MCFFLKSRYVFQNTDFVCLKHMTRPKAEPFSVKRIKLAGYFPIYRRNLALAFPVVLSQLGQVSVTLADTMMVGHTGTTELAAASFANSVFLIGMLFGFGITMGLTPLVGNAFSKGKDNEVAVLLKNGFTVHILSAILLVLILGTASLFLDRMGQPEAVVRKAFPYFLILVVSLFPLLLFYSVKQFLEGVGNTKIAMMITLSANTVNIILNYILIFGKMGCPELGLNGAGIATLTSRVLMPLMLVPFLLINKPLMRFFRVAWKVKIHAGRIRRLLAVGIPIGFQIIIEVLTFSLGAVMMGWLGKNTLAAHQIAMGMASTTYMASLGIGTGTTILVSHELGRNNPEMIRRTVFASLHMVFLFMSSMAVLFMLLRQQLPFLFTDDNVVVQIAARLLVVAGLFQIFDGLQVVLASALRGLSDVKIPMFIAFISYTLIGLPVSYFCAFVLKMDAVGIWTGFLFGLACAAVQFGIRLKKIIRFQN